MAETARRLDFGEFYSCSAARLVRHGYALTGDMAEAQDIAQEAFARAWQRWSTVRDCDSPEAWVRRVATNLAASRWRRIRVARAAAGRTADQHAPEVSTDTVALVTGLRTLPERQRTVLVLHYLCDLTVDQIAAELACPTGSVKSWLSRGRTALAEAVRVVEPEAREPALADQEPALADQASDPPEPAPGVPRDRNAGREQAAGTPENAGTELTAAPGPDACDPDQDGPDQDGPGGAAAAPTPPDGEAPPGQAVPGLCPAPVPLATPADGRGAERGRPRASWPARPEPEASHA